MLTPSEAPLKNTASRVNAWPLTVVIVAQILDGIVLLAGGAIALAIYMFIGAMHYREDASGQGGGLAGLISDVTLVGAIVGPALGFAHLAAASGLRRLKTWARRLAIGLSVLDLLFPVAGLFCHLGLGFHSLSGVALGVFTLSVLFRREYSNQFLPPK